MLAFEPGMSAAWELLSAADTDADACEFGLFSSSSHLLLRATEFNRRLSTGANCSLGPSEGGNVTFSGNLVRLLLLPDLGVREISIDYSEVEQDEDCTGAPLDKKRSRCLAVEGEGCGGGDSLAAIESEEELDTLIEVVMAR